MVDEKTLKALIEVASKSTDPDAVEGVLAVQELINENSTLKTALQTLKQDSEKEVKRLEDELGKATRTMARLMTQNGIIDKPDEDVEVYNKQDKIRQLFG